MSGNRTAGSPLVTAAEWFAGGRRIPYDPESARVLTEEEAAATPGGLRVFERVAAAEQDAEQDTVWLTMLPRFPDGSYGWARVDTARGRPTPGGARGWGGGRRPPGGLTATTRQARLSSRGYHPAPAELAELRSAITRRDGAAFLHRAAGFTAEHRRHARRWDLAGIARDLDGTVALYVGGSEEDPYEHRQIQATRQRVPQAEILTFPGGHLTTSEHPDLLAAAIRDIAARHGIGTPATAHR